MVLSRRDLRDGVTWRARYQKLYVRVDSKLCLEMQYIYEKLIVTNTDARPIVGILWDIDFCTSES